MHFLYFNFLFRLGFVSIQDPLCLSANTVQVIIPGHLTSLISLSNTAAQKSVLPHVLFHGHIVANSKNACFYIRVQVIQEAVLTRRGILYIPQRATSSWT